MTASRSTTASDRQTLWYGLLVCVWIGLFLWLFFSRELPNNRPTTGWDVWELAPYKILDAIDPPTGPGIPPRSWSSLGWRGVLWCFAAYILAGSWGWGRVALRLMNRFGSQTLEPATAPETCLTTTERIAFAGLLGLACTATLVLLLGLLGWLSFWPLIIWLGVGGRWGRHLSRNSEPIRWKSSGVAWWLVLLLPFIIGLALGSLSPSTDFDVNEYHLGGPKEWFQAGRITFLEYNVYTSFPFLTEMLLLTGMSLTGNWFEGALVGQAVLASFAPLTAALLYAAARRLHSETAGRIAAIIYLSTPWIFRISIIAYAEGGLTAYTAAAALVAARIANNAAQGNGAQRCPTSDVLLAGLLSGAAMACKYTGLVMTVLPVGLWIAWTIFRRWSPAERPLVLWTSAAWFIVGVCLTVGPWLLKNLVETGNPVYPLGYRVFGGRDLDDELAERWRKGHARPSAGSVLGEARSLVGWAWDVVAINDWQTPLIGAFAPLVLLVPSLRKRLAGVLGMTTWLFLAWWLFTHHLDRFWLPLLPTATILAACGAATLVQSNWRPVAYATLGAGWFFNLGFCATGLVGYNAGLTELQSARELAARIRTPAIEWINQSIRAGRLPAGTKVLLVGEAEIFYAEFPLVYNTVFDRSIFEEWCGQPGPFASQERPLRLPAEIRAKLQAEGITHLFVNWMEVLRYRQTYGYTDFVHPLRFAALQEDGVIGPPLQWPAGMGLRLVESLNAQERQTVERWAPELIQPSPEGPALVTSALYEVR